MKIVITLIALGALMASAATAAGHNPLVIYPDAVTVQAGKAVRFTAVSHGAPRDAFTPSQLNWKARGGTIDELGTYRAGMTPGRYVVSVRSHGLEAQATVEVVGQTAREDILPGWIFIRRWQLHPRNGSTLGLYMKAVVNGQTIKRARLFAVTDGGREQLLEDMPAHHRKRCHFHTDFDHARYQWIDLKAYDHLDRVVAHVRRQI